MSNIDTVFSACSYTYERGVIIIVMEASQRSKKPGFDDKSGEGHVSITTFIYHISGTSFSEQVYESLVRDFVTGGSIQKTEPLAGGMMSFEEEYYVLEGKTVHQWLPGSIKKPTSMHPTV